MNRNRYIQISIPHPCTANWDEMTPTERGRMCDQCNKAVTDFTSWSDGALYNFFEGGKNDNVCGRYLASQTDRPISIPYQPHSRLYRMTIALGLTLLAASHAYESQGQQRAPLSVAANNGQQASTTKPPPAGIAGQVLDDRNDPMINASVMAYVKGELKGGTITDFDGNYLIAPLDSGIYTITVISLGYDTLHVQSVGYTDGRLTMPVQKMKPAQGRCTAPVIMGFKRPIVDHFKY